MMLYECEKCGAMLPFKPKICRRTLPRISRFELIGDGREIVLYEEMEYTLQDDGRTLKVFRKPKEATR